MICSAVQSKNLIVDKQEQYPKILVAVNLYMKIKTPIRKSYKENGNKNFWNLLTCFKSVRVKVAVF